jgi:hypothetical protein
VTLRRYTICTIGDAKYPGTDAIGGDKRLLKQGFRFEVGEFTPETGPVLIEATKTFEEATALRNRLEKSAQSKNEPIDYQL